MLPIDVWFYGLSPFHMSDNFVRCVISQLYVANSGTGGVILLTRSIIDWMIISLMCFHHFVGPDFSLAS